MDGIGQVKKVKDQLTAGNTPVILEESYLIVVHGWLPPIVLDVGFMDDSMLIQLLGHERTASVNLRLDAT
jgi:hypothetical protein